MVQLSLFLPVPPPRGRIRVQHLLHNTSEMKYLKGRSPKVSVKRNLFSSFIFWVVSKWLIPGENREAVLRFSNSQTDDILLSQHCKAGPEGCRTRVGISGREGPCTSSGFDFPELGGEETRALIPTCASRNFYLQVSVP